MVLLGLDLEHHNRLELTAGVGVVARNATDRLQTALADQVLNGLNLVCKSNDDFFARARKDLRQGCDLRAWR